MTYNFDKITDRTGTDSLKFDFARERKKPEGLLPMWVADMDFPTAPEILEELQKTVAHGIFGYTEAKSDYYEAVSRWFSERYGFTAERPAIVKSPGVVFALAQTVRAFTREGDAVLIQPPVYYPFFEVVRDNNRKLIEAPLVYSGGAYSIDFAEFERKITENAVKLFLLCSPHNPVGRVWTEGELRQLSDICKRHNVIVVSDEIHCDFTFGDTRHICFGTIDDDAVIATAPSKTFNLAGLQVSNIFIKNADLRRKFRDELDRSGYSQLNTVGLAACRAAYEKGGEWLSALLSYLKGNIDYAESFIAARLPKLTLVHPEGTYLLWLDFSRLGLTQDELDARIVQGAKLWLDSGPMFGETGAGFQRINAACPRSVLNDALIRLEKEFSGD
ncbi:MAG: pyridoxal phosphate-dependent aminotransferase [Oscillospiraceae bacterium]|jgi:cystathionine beta-lyase|nr:pyridoxal phosphate-dependent aminotransferase [Oscillospiraceae bacterium]